MTWQRYNKNLRKSALLAEYFSFWQIRLNSVLEITGSVLVIIQVPVPMTNIPMTNRIKATDRVKSFLFRFIAVPAKWIRTARQYKLNIYSNKPYNIIWEHG